jgi:hypothetical protein
MKRLEHCMKLPKSGYNSSSSHSDTNPATSVPLTDLAPFHLPNTAQAKLETNVLTTDIFMTDGGAQSQAMPLHVHSEQDSDGGGIGDIVHGRHDMTNHKSIVMMSRDAVSEYIMSVITELKLQDQVKACEASVQRACESIERTQGHVETSQKDAEARIAKEISDLRQMIKSLREEVRRDL